MKRNQENKKAVTGQKQISFRRLIFEALPEIWGFQILAVLILALPASMLSSLMTWTAESAGGAVTTANLTDLLSGWRGPILLLLGGFLLFWYIVMEIFAQIYMNEDVLKGQRAGIIREMGKGIRSLRQFLTPTGILILLYIFVGVPLCGMGFSVSLSKRFYIPNFIMSVIDATPLYAIAYTVLVLVLACIGYRSIFSVHAVLVDGMKPAQARQESIRIIKAHGKKFFFRMLKHLLCIGLILSATHFLFNILPYGGLEKLGKELPPGYDADILRFDDAAMMTETDIAVIFYRFLCCLAVLMGTYLESVAVLLCGSYLMLRFTRYYLEFTRGITPLLAGTSPEVPLPLETADYGSRIPPGVPDFRPSGSFLPSDF